MGTGGRIPVRRPGTTRLSDASPNAPQDPRTASTGGRMFAELGAGVSEVAGQLEKAQSLAEETDAQNFMHTELAKLKAERANDLDTSEENHKKYYDRARLIKEEAGKKISIPYTRGIFESDADKTNTINNLEMDSIWRNKFISKGKANLDRFIEAQRQAYITADPGSPLIKLAIARRDRKIEQMAEGGFLTPEEAQRIKQDTAAKWPESKAQHDAYSNPQGFLDREAQGYYKGVDPKSMEGLRNAAQNVLDKKNREAERALKVQQFQNEGEFGKRLVAGQLSIDEIRDAEATKQITPQYADIYRKYLESPKTVIAQDKASEYASLLNEYGSLGDSKKTRVVEEDLGKLSIFRQHIIEAMANGSITRPKGQNWLDSINLNFSKGIDDVYRNSALVKKSAFSFLGSWTDSHLVGKEEREEAKMYLVDTLMGRINAEENNGPIKPSRASELAREVLSEYIRTNYPEMMGAPELTNSVSSQKEGLKPLYGGKTEAKPQKQVKPKERQYKVGDVVIAGNKKYKVKKLAEDGNHDLEEINDKAE